MDQPPKTKAIERLKKTLTEIPQLKHIPYGSPERLQGSPQFRKWYRDTCIAINSTFGEHSEQLATFESTRYSPQAWYAGASDASFQKYYIQGLDTAAALISSMIDEINEYWGNDGRESPSPISDAQRSELPATNTVFVIHGRDESTKDSVARFIQDVGLVPVILSELPAKGQTIIEKVESNSDVGYAVALLTPDDAGALSSEAELNPRARQNVIFELGFFIGKLGRRKVCALTKGEPEIPSDYAGVVYIPLDDHGAWRVGLFRELREAGFNIDADRLVGA